MRVSIWLSVRQKFINKRWRLELVHDGPINRFLQKNDPRHKSFLDWRTESDSKKKTSSDSTLDMSFKLICRRYRTENKRSHTALHHIWWEVRDGYRAWIKLFQVWRKQFNKLHFLNKSSVKRGWMKSCVHIVPDTETGNVLSWFILIELHSNCWFKVEIDTFFFFLL